MKEYAFSLYLEGTDLSEDDANRLYECGCDDALSGVSCGAPFVDFDRQAESLETAIRSALADVRKAGFRVKRVELQEEDLAALEGAQDTAAPRT